MVLWIASVGHSRSREPKFQPLVGLRLGVPGPVSRQPMYQSTQAEPREPKPISESPQEPAIIPTFHTIEIIWD